ncbi:MAG: hypothetical protein B7C24_16525, partial [Bacteroidetes bacterium 4572_77]
MKTYFKVEEITEENEDLQVSLTITVNGIVVFHVAEGQPEDANLGRDFEDCYKIVELMEMANEAGLRG